MRWRRFFFSPVFLDDESQGSIGPYLVYIGGTTKDYGPVLLYIVRSGKESSQKSAVTVTTAAGKKNCSNKMECVPGCVAARDSIESTGDDD